MIGYLHLETAFHPGGFLPPNAAFIAARLEYWARSSPGVAEVYRDPGEGTVIFKIGSKLSKNP